MFFVLLLLQKICVHYFLDFFFFFFFFFFDLKKIRISLFLTVRKTHFWMTNRSSASELSWISLVSIELDDEMIEIGSSSMSDWSDASTSTGLSDWSEATMDSDWAELIIYFELN